MEFEEGFVFFMSLGVSLVEGFFFLDFLIRLLIKSLNRKGDINLNR